MREQGSSQKFSILVVADTDKHCSDLVHRLRQQAYDIEVSGSRLEQLEKKVCNDLAAIFVDSDGLVSSLDDILKILTEAAPDTQVIALGTASNVPSLLKYQEQNNFWYLLAPYEIESLLTLVTKACVMYELKKDNRNLRSVFTVASGNHNYIGESDSIRKVINLAQKVSDLDTSLLITGESGTGKTFLAHYIHELGPRKHKPFVTVSCAAIPRDLLEAELFGHEKGSFTGAHRERMGSLELANGGTLFLDEIGEMPLELQPKLLNVLQDKSFKRIGGSEEVKADVRIITATNRNLEKMCSERLFREDLYYRINVLNIDIPPLRQRIKDIRLLCKVILTKIKMQREIDTINLTKNAFQLLENYSWPGNVRELENALERASAFCENNEITVADLSFLDSTRKNNKELTLAGMTLAELEQRALAETLEYTKGNKVQAAKMLGISLKSVYNKLDKNI